MIEIIYKSKNAVVVLKPHGMPAQRDLTGDIDCMTLTSKTLKDMGEPDALWLIHRLDRVVGGLMIFARNKETAAELSAQFRDRVMLKEYIGVVEGRPNDGFYKDFLFKDSKKNKAFIVDSQRNGVKECELALRTLATVETDNGVRSLVKVTLGTGRFHQIRAQLSYRGNPLVGDGKYGSRDKSYRYVALAAYHMSLSFGREDINIYAFPDLKEYPWSVFEGDVYDREVVLY